MTYIVFLRGINISGKNKVPMGELKAALVSFGYGNVKTYLNSGNLVLGAEEDAGLVKSHIEELLSKEFGVAVPVLVLPMDELSAVLENAPSWWGTEDKSLYHNLIFIMDGSSPKEIASKVGEPTPDLEQVALGTGVIYWTFQRERYQKCRWWKKTAEKGVGEVLTIRTAQTVRKTVGLAQ